MLVVKWMPILFSSFLLMGEQAMAYESIYPRTPVGKIEIKEIPTRTILAAQGQGDPFQSRNDSFSKRFNYIQRNAVAMTVPVEASATTSTMNFFVGSKDAKKDLKSDENIKVQKLHPRPHNTGGRAPNQGHRASTQRVMVLQAHLNRIL